MAIGKGIVDEERIGLLVEYYKNIMTKNEIKSLIKKSRCGLCFACFCFVAALQ